MKAIACQLVYWQVTGTAGIRISEAKDRLAPEKEIDLD